eukprot:CAMPEP_0169480866 /NCGR_PEP_ID=MMETSP1042-20121227/29796_1 /TAXON_ID=464988 /ORGANISM="Hemiselmis andersenii, Strain CCMP1180" /LENGTH=294 /DNA_ID=CAMNT_0009595547 /DNA_START=118 /DNA_END=998 /DNA_ORIENTATION=+
MEPLNIEEGHGSVRVRTPQPSPTDTFHPTVTVVPPRTKQTQGSSRVTLYFAFLAAVFLGLLFYQVSVLYRQREAQKILNQWRPGSPLTRRKDWDREEETTRGRWSWEKDSEGQEEDEKQEDEMRGEESWDKKKGRGTASKPKSGIREEGRAKEEAAPSYSASWGNMLAKMGSLSTGERRKIVIARLMGWSVGEPIGYESDVESLVSPSKVADKDTLRCPPDWTVARLDTPKYTGFHQFHLFQEEMEDKIPGAADPEGPLCVVLSGSFRLHPFQVYMWQQSGLVRRDVYSEVVST